MVTGGRDCYMRDPSGVSFAILLHNGAAQQAMYGLRRRMMNRPAREAQGVIVFALPER